MSEILVIRGWAPPKGTCDICHDRPARHWFGDTSVALCGHESCARINQANWDRMVEEMNKDGPYTGVTP